jgi:hypothetical protein
MEKHKVKMVILDENSKELGSLIINSETIEDLKAYHKANAICDAYDILINEIKNKTNEQIN